MNCVFFFFVFAFFARSKRRIFCRHAILQRSFRFKFFCVWVSQWQMNIKCDDDNVFSSHTVRRSREARSIHSGSRIIYGLYVFVVVVSFFDFFWYIFYSVLVLSVFMLLNWRLAWIDSFYVRCDSIECCDDFLFWFPLSFVSFVLSWFTVWWFVASIGRTTTISTSNKTCFLFSLSFRVSFA